MEDLDLKEILNIFWTRKIQISLIILIFIIIGVVYSYFFVVPQYKAYTTLVLATPTEDSDAGSETITATDISINNNLVSTYRELIRSKTVLRQVINNLGINKTEDSLKGAISVSARTGTQLIEITVLDTNPYQAKIIANEVAKVFTVKVAEIYNINNVYIVDEAEEPTSPHNVNHIKNIAIVTFVGVVIACIYVVIANLLDTTVKTAEDIEKKIGLTVLVNIPTYNYEDLPKTRKGGRK